MMANLTITGHSHQTKSRWAALRRSGMNRPQSRCVRVRATDGKTAVLFVCLGNICRSPTAEAVFTDVVKKAGVQSEFDIDSCGTGGGSSDWYLPGGFSYHEGEDADPRMTAAAKQRGVILTSKSRPLKPEDLSRFDYIIGMDPKNLKAMKDAAEYWKEEGKQVPDDYEQKLLSMATFCSKCNVETVPDPYYGGSSGFEKVLDLLDDACTGLLKHIQSK